MPFKILVVEDDIETREFLRDLMSQDGYDVELASNVKQAQELIKERAIDLVLLDVNLDEYNTGKNISAIRSVVNDIVGQEGFELAAWLRTHYKNVKIFFLTSRSSIDDRVHGLDVGGDDFIAKPFATRELRARIRAALRRFEKREDRIEFFNGWKFNVTLKEISHVTRPEMKPIGITNAESAILVELLDAQGAAISREVLSKRVFGRPLTPQDRAVDTSISKLRFKMNDERGSVNSIIETLHGLGYRLIRR